MKNLIVVTKKKKKNSYLLLIIWYIWWSLLVFFFLIENLSETVIIHLKNYNSHLYNDDEWYHRKDDNVQIDMDYFKVNNQYETVHIGCYL